MADATTTPSQSKPIQFNDGNYFRVECEENDEPEYVAPIKLPPVIKNKGAKGIFYMMISAFSFSMVAFILKSLYMHSNISAYEVTYWQNIMLIVLYYGMLRSLRQDLFKVPEDLRISLIWLGFLGFMGITGYYLALQYIDLSKAAVLYWTNPMFTAVITYFWLRESISFIDWIAIGCSFAGIVLI